MDRRFYIWIARVVLMLAPAILMAVLFASTFVEAGGQGFNPGGYQFNQWWSQPCGNAAGCPSLAGPPAPTWSFPTDTPFGQRIPQYYAPQPAYSAPYGGPVYSTGGYVMGGGPVSVGVAVSPDYGCGLFWFRCWFGSARALEKPKDEPKKEEEKKPVEPKQETKEQPKQEATPAPAPVLAPADLEKFLVYISGGRDDVRAAVKAFFSKKYAFVASPDDANFVCAVSDNDVPDPLFVVDITCFDRRPGTTGQETTGRGQARFKASKKGVDMASFLEAAWKAAKDASENFLR